MKKAMFVAVAVVLSLLVFSIPAFADDMSEGPLVEELAESETAAMRGHCPSLYSI